MIRLTSKDISKGDKFNILSCYYIRKKETASEPALAAIISDDTMAVKAFTNDLSNVLKAKSPVSRERILTREFAVLPVKTGAEMVITHPTGSGFMTKYNLQAMFVDLTGTKIKKLAMNRLYFVTMEKDGVEMRGLYFSIEKGARRGETLLFSKEMIRLTSKDISKGDKFNIL